MRRLLKYLDTPVYKDWLFYLWMISLVSVLLTPTSSVQLSLSDGNYLAALIDAVIAVAFQTALFLWLPGHLRQSSRAKKSGATP